MAGNTIERSAQEAYLKHKKISRNDLRIVLIGKSGSGKSETANNIIGEKRFDTDMSAESVTQFCHSETAMVMGKRVTVVDTPGIFDPNAAIENTQREIANFINLTLPGPHAVLLVSQIGRITEEDKQTLLKFKKQFGPEILDRMIFVFTHYDKWKRNQKPFSEYVISASKSFPVLKQYKDRYVAFENEENGRGGDEQVLKLMNIVERVVVANGGECYTNDMYKARLTEIEEERRLKEELEKSRLDKEKQEQRLKEKAAEEKGRKNANKKRKKENYRLKKKIQEIEREKEAEIEKQRLAAIKEAEERGRQQAEEEFRAKALKEKEERERKEREKEEEKKRQDLAIVKRETERVEQTELEFERIQRNQFKDLVLGIDYAVVCGIEIINNTRHLLHSPKIIMEKGVVHTPPLKILPKGIGQVITHKFPYSAFGTTGVVSWEIDRKICHLVVMWSMPFILGPSEAPNYKCKVNITSFNTHDVFNSFLRKTGGNVLPVWQADMIHEHYDVEASAAYMNSGPKTVLKCTMQDRPIKMQPSDSGNIVLMIKPEDSLEVIRTESSMGFLQILHAVNERNN